MNTFPIGRKNDKEQPSRHTAMYGCSVGEPCRSTQGVPSSVVEQSELCVSCGNGEGEGKKRLYVTNNGSYEIKEFFKLVDEGMVSLPLKTKVCVEGCSYYFEQFHTSNQEACDLICQELGIV